jgi:hypothetical protein
MIAQAVILVIAVSACFIGLNWGLVGVSWGILATQVCKTAYYYLLAYRAIVTRVQDLAKALIPGLVLNSILYLVLFIADSLTGNLRMASPGMYILAMAIPGMIAYSAAFLLIPIPSLKSEVTRWREKINGGLAFVYRSS